MAVACVRETLAAGGRLGAAALATGIGFGGTLQAQGTMSEERCKALMSIVAGISLEYQGQISVDLISDLQKKVGDNGKCDGPDEYRLWPNTKDREALGRIRQLLTVWDICQREPSREGCK